MPMLDAYIPEGALSADAERALLTRLTNLLLEAEGADPANAVAQSISKVWLHRPAAVYVAGEPALEPHYRIVAAVPEGQWDDERRAKLVAGVTEAILEAEEGRYSNDPMRVWVFPLEIPDGAWGGAGAIFRLADIAGVVMGDAEKGRAFAERRLAARRAPAPVGA